MHAHRFRIGRREDPYRRRAPVIRHARARGCTRGRAGDRSCRAEGQLGQAQRRVAGSAECAGVVKADAYGLGLEQIAGALTQEGCRDILSSQPSTKAGACAPCNPAPRSTCSTACCPARSALRRLRPAPCALQSAGNRGLGCVLPAGGPASSGRDPYRYRHEPPRRPDGAVAGVGR